MRSWVLASSPVHAEAHRQQSGVVQPVGRDTGEVVYVDRYRTQMGSLAPCHPSQPRNAMYSWLPYSQSGPEYANGRLIRNVVMSPSRLKSRPRQSSSSHDTSASVSARAETMDDQSRPRSFHPEWSTAAPAARSPHQGKHGEEGKPESVRRDRLGPSSKRPVPCVGPRPIGPRPRPATREEGPEAVWVLELDLFEPVPGYRSSRGRFPRT
jgi:hypothetical protein